MRLEHWIYTLPLKWRALVRRNAVERDLDDEIRYHLETQVDERVAGGMSREDAWRSVRRDFGGVEQSKELCRDARGTAVVETLVQDLRYAARVLRRNPGYTTASAVTLALAIGVNTAVFSLTDGILLSRLPYPAANALVSVTGTYPSAGIDAMRRELQALDVASYAAGKWFTLQAGADPVRVSGARVSAELLPLLGVAPALGRWPAPGEDVAPADRVVILSHGLWTTRFRGDGGIVGTFVELDGVRREVIAVMPASFRFPTPRTELWVPLGIDPSNTVSYWAGDFMPIVGRLRAGASIEQATADVRAFQARIAQRFPWPMPNDWNKDLAVISLHEDVVGDVRSRLLILLAAVALVLVIACANVANLSLSKAATRQREIAVRTALGASPARIARQLLTESALLASLGGMAGLLVASQALTVLEAVLPADTPRLEDVRLNGRVLLFTAILSLVTGCAFGMAPVLTALRQRLRMVLDAGGRSVGAAAAGPLRAVLTIGQVACAVLLVIAAGLLVRSLWTLSQASPGFRSERIVTARISPAESVCGSPERCLAFYRALGEQVESDAGITDAALVNTLPLSGDLAKRSVTIDGFTVPPQQTPPLLWLHAVTPSYFRVIGIRVEAGRGFTREDLTGPPVAIVSAATARRFWINRSPIGGRVRFVGEQRWHTVVGVAADVRGYDLAKDVPDWMQGTMYVPHGPYATMEDGRLATQMTLVVQTALAADRVQALVRRAATNASPGVVVDDVRPLRAVLERAVAAPAATASLLATIAALALVLGCIGVYGVLSFLVSRRSRELGIRFALGAQRRDVFWLVIREGATLCAAGVAIGIAGAFVLTRWLSSELHGVSPTDPTTYIAVSVVMTLVTLTACYVPTRRAMRVDPVMVMREQ